MNDLATRLELNAEWLFTRATETRMSAAAKLRKSWVKNSPAKLAWEVLQHQITRDEELADKYQIWAYWIRKYGTYKF